MRISEDLTQAKEDTNGNVQAQDSSMVNIPLPQQGGTQNQTLSLNQLAMAGLSNSRDVRQALALSFNNSRSVGPTPLRSASLPTWLAQDNVSHLLQAFSARNYLSALNDSLQQQSLPSSSLGYLGTSNQQEQLLRWLLANSNAVATPLVAGQPRSVGASDTIVNDTGLHPSHVSEPPPSSAAPPSSASSNVTDTTFISPTTLYVDGDEETLTSYQCLLRKQLEIFEAEPKDVRSTAQGRSASIVIGQIGVRCRHCASLPNAARAKGAVYYSKTIDGIYQIAQNMSNVHLCEKCYRIPPDIQMRLHALKSNARRAVGGKEYWVDCLRSMGVYEDGQVLRLKKPDNQP